jgi:hypothetical protein
MKTVSLRPFSHKEKYEMSSLSGAATDAQSDGLLPFAFIHETFLQTALKFIVPFCFDQKAEDATW